MAFVEQCPNIQGKHVKSLYESHKHKLLQIHHPTYISKNTNFTFWSFNIRQSRCEKQFTEQGYLTMHIQSSHEGVKYDCNECDYQTTRQDSLTIHIQSIHESIKYPCNQCDYEATRKV